MLTFISGTPKTVSTLHPQPFIHGREIIYIVYLSPMKAFMKPFMKVNLEPDTAVSAFMKGYITFGLFLGRNEGKFPRVWAVEKLEKPAGLFATGEYDINGILGDA